MKKIMIFGASGNIGQYLIDYFDSMNNGEVQIIAIGRSECDFSRYDRVEYYKVDISNKYDFEKLPKDIYAVIDLAGAMPAKMEGYHPEQYIYSNIIGTFNVLEFCKCNSIDRIVYTQSFFDIKNYGDKDIILRPEMIPNLNYNTDHSVYSVTKNTAVELIKCYNAMFGIKAFVFRLPNIYMWTKGDTFYVDGVKKRIAWRYLIEEAIKGNPIEVWGDYNRVKDMVYVKDLCQMLYNACFVDIDFGHYNVGTGIGITLLDQIKGIIMTFSENKQSDIVFCPDKPNAPQYIMDISNAVEELNYQPKYDYLSMLQDIKKERELDRF